MIGRSAKGIDPPQKTSSMKVVLVIVGILFAVIALAGMGLGIYALIQLQQIATTNTTKSNI